MLTPGNVATRSPLPPSSCRSFAPGVPVPAVIASATELPAVVTVLLSASRPVTAGDT